MPTELEELVEFLHHGNTQIRQIAVENLVSYSTTQPSVFKSRDLEPVKDLKLLLKDYTPIAKNALNILINISNDQQVLQNLASDDAFLESLLARITSPKEPNADDMAMLLANLAKSDSMNRILNLTRTCPAELSASKNAMTQLLDCFVKGPQGRYNKHANFDYLAYFFADIAKLSQGQAYFTSQQSDDDNIIPLTKLVVFTEHSSAIRRQGVASTIKNVAFEISSHPMLISPSPIEGVNLLPYILLPIMGPEEYSLEDSEGMLDELQLLPPDKERERETEIIKIHLETLLILSTTIEVRELLRRIKLYPIIRETHLHVNDEDVRDACDRIVQVIMRDEADGEDHDDQLAVKDADEDDEDHKMVEVL